MGLMDALAGGLSEAAGGAAKIGFDMIQSQIDQDRQAALVKIQEEVRLRTDATMRSRGREDAEQERSRVAKFSAPVTSQPNGLISAGAGLNDANSVGADENVGVDVQKRERDSTQRERQNRATMAGDLASAERFGKDADRTEDNALNEKRLAAADARQNAWNANEAAKRENEAKRIEALFARIGSGKDKTPSRVAEAQQIMENINKDRVAAGKPKITFEDALAMHFRAADPAKETVTYQGDDSTPVERKVTRPVGSKEGEPRKVIKFGELK